MLDGYVDDVDTADVGTDASMVTWTSSIDGALGNDLTLETNVLSTGTHTITMAVDDGAGGITSDAISVTVVEGFDELAEPATELIANTQAIYLDMESGVLTGTLFIANVASKQIAWSAESTGWVDLSITAGQTSAEITVSADLSTISLEPGYAEETITFSSPDAMADLEVAVILYVPGQSPNETEYLFLPMIIGP